MAKRKVRTFESKDLTTDQNLNNIVDQKYILLELLTRIKNRSDAAENTLGNAIGRIDKLEETTKDILHKFKQHLKDCEHGNNNSVEKASIELLASKLVRNLEKRIAMLEISVANTNKKISASSEEKNSLLEKVRELQKEAQLTKKACLEIIHYELKKSKDLRGDCNNTLREFIEEMKHSSPYGYSDERKVKKQKRVAPY